jgi:predicted Fe-Mo cluster-binding NifX family protein
VRIAVSSTGPGLESEIDPRFGRCECFVIVDSDSMEAEAVSNPNVMAAGGAGIQTAQLVADKGAQVVLTGNCGPNAFQTLQAAGLEVYVGVTGTVGGAVERFKKGEFKPVSGPSVGDKHGLGGGPGGKPGLGSAEPSGWTGPGMGRRGGMGRGGGMAGAGTGRGMGRGRGMGMGRCGWGGAGGGFAGFSGAFRGRWTRADELETLKAEAESLEQDLEAVRRRIEELKEGGSK